MGSLESGALVRMMIQCESSHCFAGKISLPKVAPACNSIVSPQDARATACDTSSPACTTTRFPGAGVADRELSICTLGNSAGPSCELALVPLCDGPCAYTTTVVGPHCRNTMNNESSRKFRAGTIATPFGEIVGPLMRFDWGMETHYVGCRISLKRI